MDGKTYSSEELIVVISDEATTPNPKSEEYNPFGSWDSRPSYRRMPEQKEQPKKKENPSKTSKRKKVYKM